jgi:hypothetical protein
LGQQLIEAWGFMACLADLFGAPPFSMEALLGGLLQGASSPLLGLVHVLLLRQAQADMEEAHATGVLQVGLLYWLVETGKEGGVQLMLASTLLRQAQVDMEQAHATGVLQVG